MDCKAVQLIAARWAIRNTRPTNKVDEVGFLNHHTVNNTVSLHSTYEHGRTDTVNILPVL